MHKVTEEHLSKVKRYINDDQAVKLVKDVSALDPLETALIVLEIVDAMAPPSAFTRSPIVRAINEALEEEKAPDIVCADCGATGVQKLCWVDTNTNEVIDPQSDTFYCEKCGGTEIKP